MIHYDQFGGLRFLEHFPRTSLYYDDDIGGSMTLIGPACIAGYGFTGFARLEGQKSTGAINLDFSQDCPESEGNGLMAVVGLNFRCGATFSAVRIQLGPPEVDRVNPEGFRFCTFTTSQPWPYVVTCAFAPSGKLYKVGVARKDLVDIATARGND